MHLLIVTTASVKHAQTGWLDVEAYIAIAEASYRFALAARTFSAAPERWDSAEAEEVTPNPQHQRTTQRPCSPWHNLKR